LPQQLAQYVPVARRRATQQNRHHRHLRLRRHNKSEKPLTCFIWLKAFLLVRFDK